MRSVLLYEGFNRVENVFKEPVYKLLFWLFGCMSLFKAEAEINLLKLTSDVDRNVSSWTMTPDDDAYISTLESFIYIYYLSLFWWTD